MTIYKPGYDRHSPTWKHGEWGNRNALGKALILIEFPFVFVLMCLASMGNHK